MRARAWRVALTLAVAASASCSKGATDQDYDDVAQALGPLVSSGDGGDVGAMQDSVAAAQGDVPAGLTASGMGTLSGTRGGLSYSYTLTCQDAGGAAMAACSDQTDSARLMVSWSGDLSLPSLGWMGAVSRTGDWTVTGLTSPEAQFDGQGTFDVRSEFRAIYRPVTRSFHLSYQADYQAIRFRTSDGVATSGTAHFDIAAERTSSRASRSAEVSFQVDAVVTFTGAGTATIVLDGSRHYTVQLANGTVVKS